MAWVNRYVELDIAHSTFLTYEDFPKMHPPPSRFTTKYHLWMFHGVGNDDLKLVVDEIVIGIARSWFWTCIKPRTVVIHRARVVHLTLYT